VIQSGIGNTLSFSLPLVIANTILYNACCCNQDDDVEENGIFEHAGFDDLLRYAVDQNERSSAFVTLATLTATMCGAFVLFLFALHNFFWFLLDTIAIKYLTVRSKQTGVVGLALIDVKIQKYGLTSHSSAIHLTTYTHDDGILMYVYNVQCSCSEPGGPSAQDEHFHRARPERRKMGKPGAVPPGAR